LVKEYVELQGRKQQGVTNWHNLKKWDGVRTVAYRGIFLGGDGKQIQLRTEGTENGVWGR
jgi:hypothetical protein